MELAVAVEHAVTECIKENILKDFLTKYRSEAIAVCIFEFDEEKYKKIEQEVWMERGMEQGLQQGFIQGKNRLRLLIQRMTEAGEADQLSNLADEVFMERMYEKYQT